MSNLYKIHRIIISLFSFFFILYYLTLCTSIDIKLIRCQFPFLDRVVTVHANTFHEHRTYRAREKRKKEMIIYGRSKKDRKKESGVSV